MSITSRIRFKPFFFIRIKFLATIITFYNVCCQITIQLLSILYMNIISYFLYKINPRHLPPWVEILFCH
nr:MAG TPA: hypothetical protein [Caudoviricetes sp.]